MKDSCKFELFRKKKILITGGAGFIGTHLAQKLVVHTEKVVCLDNYLVGRKEIHVEGVDYIEGDVSNINHIFANQEFDYIFHLGEYSRVEQSLFEPYVALSNIYRSFPALLQFWRASGAKLIYSGSSTKFSENGNGRHLSPYTAAKALNTELLCDFAKWYDLPFCIVYFYNVYGGYELREGKYATVIGKFKDLVSKGATTLPVNSPGTQRRNFTHVDDVTDGMLLVAVSAEGDGFGIGADESHSIIEVCKAFQCEPILQLSSPSNRMNGELHNKKLKDLGWRQKHFLMQHIDNFMQNL